MSEAEKKGPSKNELKKAAKKAEKAAKKQAAKAAAAGGGGGAPAAAAAATAAAGKGPPGNNGNNGNNNSNNGNKKGAAKAAAAAPKVEVPAPKLLLVNGAEKCTATLKLVYASLHYKVAVSAGTKKDVPTGFAGTKPALVFGDDFVLGGGGNCMAKAVSSMAGCGTANGFMVDEWCEIERTSRAGSLPLDKIAAALEASSTGIHLVGDADTVADLCIIVMLSQDEANKPKWPAAVLKYYKAHAAALQKAVEAVPDFLPPPAVDPNNPSLQTVVTQIFIEAFETLFPAATIPAKVVAKCKDSKHGDYQCTAAMALFGTLKKTGGLPQNINSPQQIADAVVAHLGTSHPIISDLAVQKPAFIVCRLTPAFLQKHVQRIVTTGQLTKPAKTPIQCVVDFSSPNIAKEMHVGHLRSTIIGESVCRILEFVGHTVERVNHVGDWGTQFGMLIQFLKEEYPNFSDNMPNITDLTAFYKAAKQRFDDDADFKKTAQLNVVKLQAGDEECMNIWRILCDVSRKEFQKVYDRLDINVKECGESFYNDKIPAVIDEFNKAGLIRIEEGGAKCVFVGKFKVPLMLQKSDGGYGYDSTDMAALKHRLQTIKAKRIIVITDFTQADHFTMCNTAATDIGWINEGQKLQHIGFGTVMGEDGKRFKTRSGDTVRLVDLLDEAVGRMEESLKQRITDGKANITEAELHEVAEACGYGAVKYFDLRRNPTTNYKFSYDAMLDTKGNTAIYLLYARVRLESIIAKAKAECDVDLDALLKSGEQIALSHPSERNLALTLQQFTDVIDITLEDMLPYHICDYVYSLAISASDFVTQCRVLKSDEMKSRLLLCHVTTIAMKQCFELLGIRHVKRI